MTALVKVVVFAGGLVGARVVEYMLSRFSYCVAGLVVSPDDDKMELILSNLPPAISVSVWHVDMEEATHEMIRSIRPDVVVLAWWPLLLKHATLQLGQKYTLNMHPSLLPNCRGKDPNFWSIVEQRPFGVTIHHVDRGVDTGDVAFQREIVIDWQDTGETLYRKSQEAMISLFQEVFPRIMNLDIPKVSQSAQQGSYHRRNELESASRIDLNRKYSGRELLDILRARTFPPHPSAHFEDRGETYDVRITIEKRSK